MLKENKGSLSYCTQRIHKETNYNLELYKRKAKKSKTTSMAKETGFKSDIQQGLTFKIDSKSQNENITKKTGSRKGK